MKLFEACGLKQLRPTASTKRTGARDIIKSSRVPIVHRSTASSAVRAAGHKTLWRTARTKLARAEADQQERKTQCDKVRKKPVSYL